LFAEHNNTISYYIYIYIYIIIIMKRNGISVVIITVSREDAVIPFVTVTNGTFRKPTTKTLKLLQKIRHTDHNYSPHREKILQIRLKSGPA